MASTPNIETVTSADGTHIAYERRGSGPPLVLVHGTSGRGIPRDREGSSEVRPAFEEHFTVYAIDRRGRGESGDADAYAIEREVEDIAAVVDSIDEPVNLHGFSHGAVCSLEVALRTDNLHTLVLYEPGLPVSDTWPFRGPEAQNMLAEMETLVAEGENEQALMLLHEMLPLPKELDEHRSEPNWPDRVATAHTLPRELRAVDEYEFDAARFEDMTTPTLLLSGSESPQFLKDATEAVNSALPNSRVAILEGQAHGAMGDAPELYVDKVLTFIREQS